MDAVFSTERFRDSLQRELTTQVIDLCVFSSIPANCIHTDTLVFSMRYEHDTEEDMISAMDSMRDGLIRTIKAHHISSLYLGLVPELEKEELKTTLYVNIHLLKERDTTKESRECCDEK